MQLQQDRAASDSGAPAAAVRAQLRRILRSHRFARSDRLRRFLAHVVDEGLAGRLENLKEYSLGVDVCDRGVEFDPAADPIVRVDARRLRKALADYYAGEGAADPVEIGLPTGSYLPAFRVRPQGPERWSQAFDQTAYELYLRGRRRLNATRAERMADAIALLSGAVACDPDFADAWSAIAEAHFVTAIFGLKPPAEALASSRAAALRALAADPELAVAHAQLGRVSAALDHDFEAARRALDRAVALNPGSPAVRQARAMWLLAPLGELSAAVAELEPMLAQKPYSRRLRVDYARLLVFQGRYPEAIRHLELVLEFEPDMPGAPWALAMAHEHAGDAARARALHEQQVRQFERAFPLVGTWLDAARAAWDHDIPRAREIVAEMERRASSTPVAASVMTDAWLRVGEPDRALDWLERAAEQRMLRAMHLAVDPDYESLRTHPRFTSLVERMGLPAFAS